MSVQIDSLKVSETTGLSGVRLTLAIPAAVPGNATASLDRREVEELRDACDRWLDGERL